MANLENLSLDARTFPQFCEHLSKREWIDLQSDLMQKLKKSGQCIYKWKKGQSMPMSAMERVKISEYINKKFNILTRHWVLFPEP